jgi:acetyltransferase-like isoleucine patch superfamily enzyme
MSKKINMLWSKYIVKLFRNITRGEQNINPIVCIRYGKVNIYELNGGKIEIHPTVILNSNPIGYHVAMPFETTLLADRPDSIIQIGKNCRIHGSYIHATKSICIGKGVLIAAGTTIVDSHGHSSNIKFARFRQFVQDEPQGIIIGDFVWIGMNCIILKGVTIGECSVISAGTVVKKDIPPFSVVEGNPARVIKSFDPKDSYSESYPIEELSKDRHFYNYTNNEGSDTLY